MLVEESFEFTGLMHTKNDITSAHKLAVHVYLRNRRPFAEFFDSASELRVLQDIISLHLLW